ncbi:hypothetical protein TL16_g04963 [Triparma laevis f. inornata]|uniref:Uncharacterized protein n=1 Tax=Triparma laevis f. inornata TaxID=1714386 RepID=A0A9W7ADE8_9STRA|nr:hypothetical protein TL16_g04963 [Triparma laevis f. inornata]
MLSLLNPTSHSPIPPTHVPPSFLSSSSSSPNKSKTSNTSRRNRQFKQSNLNSSSSNQHSTPQTPPSSSSNNTSKPPSRQPSVDALTLSMLKSVETWKSKKPHPPTSLPTNPIPSKPVLFTKRFAANGTWEDIAFPKLAGWERSASDIIDYDKTYESVSSELVRQVSILCREKGEVVGLMEKARKEFLENIGGRVQECSDAVEMMNSDQKRLLDIMTTFVRIIDTQKDRSTREVNDWKGQIEDEHKLELARMERRVEMEREHEKINSKCASIIQSLARMRLAKKSTQVKREHRAVTRINTQARRLFATRVVRERKAERKNLDKGARFLQRCWRGTVVRIERVKEIKETRKMDEASKLISSYLRMKRDRSAYLRQKTKIDNEKNKPYWALIQRCNDMCEKLAAVEHVVLGVENEADLFDDRAGSDRFPLLSGRIKSLEDIIEFRANLDKSKVRAEEFNNLSEKKGIVLNMPAGHAHHNHHHNHHHHHHHSQHHHGGHGGHHGHHRRSSRRPSQRSLLLNEPLSPTHSSNDNYSEGGGESDSVRTHSQTKSERANRRSRARSSSRPAGNAGGEQIATPKRRKSRSHSLTRASSSTRNTSSGNSNGNSNGNEMARARDEAMQRFREEATMRLRESEEIEGGSGSGNGNGQGLTIDTGNLGDEGGEKLLGFQHHEQQQQQQKQKQKQQEQEQQPYREPRRTRMISPVSPSGIHEEHFNELEVESWGGANNSLSPTMDGPQTPGMNDLSMTNMSNEKQIQFIEAMYAGTIADMKLRSGERVKDIDRSVDKEFVEGRESLKMLQRQIDAAERVNEFIESEAQGYFDVQTYLGRENLVFDYGSSSRHSEEHHGHGHGHHGEHGHGHHRDSPHLNEDMDSNHGHDGSPTGKGKSPTSNKVVLADDGTISLGNRTDCQPLLRAIEDVFSVTVRKPKTLPITLRLVEGVLRSVGEEMHRGGIDFHGLRAVKAIGHNLVHASMVKSHELRDYLYSGENSPEANMRVGVFWRLPQIEASKSIRHTVQAQRGNDKATDQVLIDLVRGCSSHRSESRYLDTFCRVVEVDETSSGLPFLIYCRHLLAEWQVANKDKGDVITYEMTIALGATLFRIEDRELVKMSAKKAIAKKDLDIKLRSSNCHDMEHDSQLDCFFERIWASCYDKNDEESKQLIKSTSMKKINDKIEGKGGNSSPASLPGSHSPKAAKRKTMQLLDGGRRRSIVELGGGGGTARGTMNMKAAMAAAALANDANMLTEGNENESDSDDEEDEERIKKHEVDEAKLLYHVNIGSVLDVAVDCHLMMSLQQKLGVWATVAFVNADRFNKGNLTALQFKVAMEGTSNPVRDEETCTELFNDLVFASDDSHMSFKTFYDSMWNLYVEGELKFPEVSEEDVSDVALRMECGKYVI